MLVIRGFEERVARLYRAGEVPGLRPPVDRPGGLGGGGLLAAGCGRRHHLDPPGPRSLPGQGPGPPRHVRRAHGPGRGHQPGPRRFDAHRGSRTSASSGRTGSWPPACPSRSGRRPRPGCGPTAASPSPSSATGRWPRGRSTRRSTSPPSGRCRSSSSVRTTATPSSPPPPTSTGPRWRPGPRGTASTTWPVDGNDVVATAAVMTDVVGVPAGRARSGHRRGRHLPVARPLRGRPGALPLDRGGRGVGGPGPAGRPRCRARERRA